MSHPFGRWNTSDGSHRATLRDVCFDIAFVVVFAAVVWLLAGFLPGR